MPGSESTMPRHGGGTPLRPASTAAGTRMGKLLLDSQLITQRQYDEALAIQSRFGGELVDILFSLGYVEPSYFLRFLATNPNVERAELSQFEIQPDHVAALPGEFAHRYRCVPIDANGRMLTLGCAAALDIDAVRAIEAGTGRGIKPVLCKPADVLAALHRYYPESAPPDAPPAPAPDPVEALAPSVRLHHVAHLIRQIKTLPALPETVAQIREAVSNPEVAVASVVDIITMDPPIAAKVLSVANSAAYGFQHRINDLTLAVSLLGLREVYNIVLSAAVVDLIKKLKDFDYRLFWLESICCATASRIVVRAMGRRQLPGAFTAGLLRDLGRAALWDAAPQLCAKLSADARGKALIEAEHAILGIAHTEAGYELAAHWNLPVEIAEPMRFHHDPQLATTAREHVAVVAVADAMAGARGVKLEENLHVFEGLHDTLAFLNIDQENAEAMLERYLERCEQAAQEAFG